MVLDRGNCNNEIEWHYRFENNEPVLYRLGSISIEEINQGNLGKFKIKNKQEIAPMPQVC